MSARHGADAAFALGVVGVAGVAAVCWAAQGLASLATGRGLHDVAPSSCLALLVEVLAHPASPGLGRRPSSAAFYGALAALVGLLAVVGRALVHARTRLGRSAHAVEEAAWARPRDLKPLIVGDTSAGRVAVGRLAGRLVALEAGHSLLVLGPTQSGKTSGLAIPAILEWGGPVVATSVKGDLLAHTLGWREQLGRALVYDPLGSTGSASVGWSPLTGARTWAGARRVAAGLCALGRAASGGLEDGAFWYATAEKLLAPLLFAAASAQCSMADVVRWLDTWEEAEVMVALARTGVREAIAAAQVSFGRDERQRSSVYTTAETVVAAFADPAVEAASRSGELLEPEALLTGAHTLYLVAPGHEQERLAPLFVAIIQGVFEAAFNAAARAGRPLQPPLLAVLDEAANVAPLSDLDRVAATGASQGIQLVTVFQDLAQIEARYGRRAWTIVNNHRAKLVCSGIADPSTLEQLSSLIGEEERPVDSTTLDSSGQRTTTWSRATRRLAPAHALRRVAPGEAVLVYGHLAPARLELRPYYAERSLARRARPAPSPGPGGGRAPTS